MVAFGLGISCRCPTIPLAALRPETCAAPPAPPFVLPPQFPRGARVVPTSPFPSRGWSVPTTWLPSTAPFRPSLYRRTVRSSSHPPHLLPYPPSLSYPSLLSRSHDPSAARRSLAATVVASSTMTTTPPRPFDPRFHRASAKFFQSFLRFSFVSFSYFSILDINFAFRHPLFFYNCSQLLPFVRYILRK